MRQVVQSRRSGKVWLARVPAPACGKGGVLVRTRCSVVSAGTERQSLAFAGKSLLGKARARPDLVKQVVDAARTEGPRPAVAKALARLDEAVGLGYSAAGDVVEAGAEAGGLAPGERVAVGGVGYAMHAEFNAVPRNLCVRLPAGVSYADGAFATVGAVALQAVRRAEPQIGERVAVIGLGLIGLLAVQILKAGGCAVLGVDLDADRVALARALGADAAVGDGDEAERACDAFTGGRGADAVVVAAATPSSEPIERAARLSRTKGRVVAVGVVGMNVPREAFYRKELDLRLSMSYGPGRYDPDYEERGRDYPFAHVRFTEQRNMESFLYLVQQGKVTPGSLVTHRLPFDEALDAYALIGGGGPDGRPRPGGCIGIVLEYPAGAAPDRTVAYREGARAPAAGRGAVGVGVIGAGRFARGVLLPHLARLAGVRLAAVCTRNGATAHDAARRFRFERATTDPAAVLGDEGVEAVIVATRHASHAALAAAALRAGKNVFVEKPLCLAGTELDDVRQALDDARAAGQDPCLMVGFNRRFSPHAHAVRRAFADRGTPMVVAYRVNAGAVPAGSWLVDPAEGGRIVGEGCHFVDFCGALIDAEPAAVTAHRAGSGGDAADDPVVMTVRYADASLASILYLTAGDPGLPKERCEVFAAGRAAVIDDFRVTRFHGGGRTVRGRQAKGFPEELRAFLDACRGGGPWPISWSSLAATHRVCFAAVRSLETGREVRLRDTPAA